MKKLTFVQRQKGAALLVYLLIMSLFVGILLSITYSRLLLALKRNQSTSEILTLNYEAESEINDIIAKLAGGYLSSPLNFNQTKTVGANKFTIIGSQSGDSQIITVTGSGPNVSTKITGERILHSINSIDHVDIMLSLDCTGSMDAGANCSNCNSKPTRFNAQESAAISFVDNLASLPNRDKFRLGVNVFGVDSKWLTFRGVPVKPNTNLNFSDIKTAIEEGFGDTRATSPACNGTMDATSIGSAFAFSHDYFKDNKEANGKQIEVVITDGEPNSRIPYAPCQESVFCPAFPKDTNGNNLCDSNAYGWSCYKGDTYKNGPYSGPDQFNSVAYNTCAPVAMSFLQCTIADKNSPYTTDSNGPRGARDPEVDAYAVTIFNNPPADVVSSFQQYIGLTHYFNASQASQLNNLLTNIFKEIVTDKETITLKKDLPGT